MTLQEIYNRVRRHLLTQKKRSEVWIPSSDPDIPGSWHCLYRSPGGCKCSIGCLIPDEYYTPLIEGIQLSSHLLVAANEEDPGAYWYGPLGRVLNYAKIPANLATLALLRDLQVIHDKWPVERWEAALDSVAQRFVLEVERGETARHQQSHSEASPGP